MSTINIHPPEIDLLRNMVLQAKYFFRQYGKSKWDFEDLAMLGGLSRTEMQLAEQRLRDRKNNTFSATGTKGSGGGRIIFHTITRDIYYEDGCRRR